MGPFNNADDLETNKRLTITKKNEANEPVVEANNESFRQNEMVA